MEITYEQFEAVVKPILDEAVGIANSLMDRLQGQDERLDWLILSGKTCNLQLVEQEIRWAFGPTNKNAKKFIWNPERVTFMAEYAKLATAIGACYAEHIKRYTYSPENSRQDLKAGDTKLDIDVRNLFFSLPCIFMLEEVKKPLFQFTDLKLLDSSGLAKARTEWKGLPMQWNVDRKDSENSNTKENWGGYRLEYLKLEDLGWSVADARENLQVRFEVDHQLEIALYFRHKGVNHYQMPATGKELNLFNYLNLKAPVALPAGKPAAGKPVAAPPAAAPPSLPPQLPFPIAINVIESDGKNPVVLFEQGQAFPEVFRLAGGGVVRGMFSKLKHPFPLSKKHTFFARQGQGKWTRLDELGMLSLDDANQASDKHPPEHCVTLDQQGRLRLHIGDEPPFWIVATAAELKKQPGAVFRDRLQPSKTELDDGKDPFCGRH